MNDFLKNLLVFDKIHGESARQLQQACKQHLTFHMENIGLPNGVSNCM